jgi:DNA-binding MarR family transcriptional regulator
MNTEDDLVRLRHRVRGEFLEMPGLMVEPTQAARLWATDRAMTTQILDDLVESGFLWKTRDGSYLRT